jgi:hypothetical protein
MHCAWDGERCGHGADAGHGRFARRRAELAMTTHPPFNQAMERNNEL